MIRKRIPALLSLFLAAAVSVAGCSSTEKKKDESVKQVTISYWSIFQPGTDEATKHAELIKAFEDANPGIKIDHLGTNFWDYFTKIQTAQAGGTDPDVQWNDIVNVRTRADAGIIANLDKYANAADGIDANDFIAADLDWCKYNNSLYAMPFSSDSRFLYWNKADFRDVGLDPEKPPKTLAEIEEYADKLTQKDDKGSLTRVGFHPRLGNNSVWQIIWTQGGDCFDKDGNPTLNSPANLAAVEWWVKMTHKYSVKAYQAFNTQASAMQISPFISGKVSMVIDGNWLYTDIKKKKPDLDFGVTSVPYVDENNHSHWSGGFTLEMSARSKDAKAEAAWKFIKYLSNKEAQMKTFKDLGWLPCNLQALNDPQIAGDDKGLQFIIAESKYRRHTDYIAAAPTWWIYLDPEVQAAEAKRKTVQAALDDAQTNLKKAIDNYNSAHPAK